MSDTPDTSDKPSITNRNAVNPQFQVERHKQLIENRGLDTLWEKSYLCPCRTKMTGSPDPLCPLCHGRGIAYLTGKFEKVAYQNQDRGVVNGQFGLMNTGTAIGTTVPDSKITFWDRLTLSDVSLDHHLIFDVTDSRIKNGIHLAYNVSKITYAVTNNAKPLFEIDDYIFDEEANILYPKDHLIGKNISINIETVLRYIVIDITKEARMQYTNKGKNNEQVDSLSKKLLLKREDAFVNSVSFTTGDSENPAVSKEYKEENKATLTSKGGFFGGALGE